MTVHKQNFIYMEGIVLVDWKIPFIYFSLKTLPPLMLQKKKKIKEHLGRHGDCVKGGWDRENNLGRFPVCAGW